MLQTPRTQIFGLLVVIECIYCKVISTPSRCNFALVDLEIENFIQTVIFLSVMNYLFSLLDVHTRCPG